MKKDNKMKKIKELKKINVTFDVKSVKNGYIVEIRDYDNSIDEKVIICKSEKAPNKIRKVIGKEIAKCFGEEWKEENETN